MNDSELIGYCEIHCKTERALFNADQINRIAKLAYPDDYFVPVVGWHSMHEEMQDLVDRARLELTKQKETP